MAKQPASMASSMPYRSPSSLECRRHADMSHVFQCVPLLQRRELTQDTNCYNFEFISVIEPQPHLNYSLPMIRVVDGKTFPPDPISRILQH